jgi:nitrous oxidase accessory protein NosD
LKLIIIRQILVFGIILLFIGVSSLSSYGQTTEEFNTIQPILKGNILYVGGSGPGNYSKIQDAINDTSNGDTVFVYNGTYNEGLIINKKINLIGENPKNTIINSKKRPIVIQIDTDNVKVQGFSISTIGNEWMSPRGIKLGASFCKISYCRFIYVRYIGIMISESSKYNTIYKNSFQNLSVAIDFENQFSVSNTIKQNNFISVKLVSYISFHNNWISNYYDDWKGYGPKIIFGDCYYRLSEKIYLFFWFNIDWYPSKVPYDIYYSIKNVQLMN